MKRTGKYFFDVLIYKEFSLNLLRCLLLIGSLVGSGFISGWLAGPVDPANPDSYAFSGRAMIAPFAAVVCVLIAGTGLLQDIYEIKSFKDTLHYVFSTMFAFSSSLYQQLIIDGAKKIIPKGKINLIDNIGGPGFLIVQPGNGVFLKFLWHPSRIVINHPVFLAPFEMVGPIINLDDQHSYIPEMVTWSHDGIKVRIKDINFRFRSYHRKDIQRSIDTPYPFDMAALKRRAQNQSVNDFGPVDWNMAVQQNLQTAIRKYVNSKEIDELTAPVNRQIDDHRRQFREAVMKETLVWAIGAELLWVDVGHMEIVEEDVDEARINLWATDWIGKDNVERAYTKAKRKAIIKQARSEVRAEMIMGILHSLENIDPTENPAEKLRKIFLKNTADLLDMMGRALPPIKNPNEPPKEDFSYNDRP